MPLRRLGSLVLVLILAGLVALHAEDEPAGKPDQESQPAAAGKAGESKTPGKLTDDEYYQLFKSLADTVDQVERNYVKEVDRRELMQAAIKGILDKLDPYSSYIPPEELTSFKTSVESQFGGIGIQVTTEDGQLKVASPLVGTPAYRAGIQAGDRIVKIEGEPTKGLAIDEAIRRLKGEAGTTVTFTVLHALDNKEETVTIKREIIHIDTVLGDVRKPNDQWEFMYDADKKIGYIRLTAFSRETASELKKALDDLTSRGMQGLVLDLRFNPGGLLTSAVEVSDLFLSKGKIVSTKGRSTPERTWEAKQEGTYEGFRIAVLVNRFSASASEILAACLQDHNKAIVIGERTWGKGSVQNVIELENGKSALKLTTASYQRPNGHNIHRFPDAKETDEWGVKPNDGYEIKLSEAEVAHLWQYRRQRDLLVAKPRGLAAATQKPASEPQKSDTSPEAKSDGDQPAAAGDSSKSPPKPESSGETKSSDAGESADNAATKKAPETVDKQFEKALEYLTSELARAE